MNSTENTCCWFPVLSQINSAVVVDMIRRIQPADITSVYDGLRQTELIIDSIDENALINAARRMKRYPIQYPYYASFRTFVVEPSSLDWLSENMKIILENFNDDALTDRAFLAREELLRLYQLYVEWIKHARNRTLYLLALNHRTGYGDMPDDVKRYIGGYIG